MHFVLQFFNGIFCVRYIYPAYIMSFENCRLELETPKLGWRVIYI